MTRSRRVFEALLSGCIVYALMAACSSSAKQNQMATTTGSGGHAGTGGIAHGGNPASGGHGGNTGNGGTGPNEGGLMDALMDPVSDAMAGLENPQSGSRLKAKYVMGSDGSKQYTLSANEIDAIDFPPFVGGVNTRGVQQVWYDSMLMADCVFYTAADGKQRCLPGRAYSPTSPFGVMFSDNQCTQPIIPVKQTGFGCTPYAVPSYALAVIPSPAGACPVTTLGTPPIHAYKVGAKIAEPATKYIVENSSMGVTCTALNGIPAADYYALTEVPASNFVEGTAGIDP